MSESETPRFGVSYFGNRYPHHARQDMRAIAEAGCGFVVLVMSESDLRWNPGTMTELVAIARAEGLEPWLTAWAIGGVFGGETASYAVGEHPEACQRDSNGQYLPALCPRQPAFRALMESWLDVAAATGVRIVQWDEPQVALPFRSGAAPYACRCGHCQAAFQERFGAEMPPESTPEVELFVDDLLSELIDWLAAAAWERGLESAVVLLPDENYDSVRARAAAELPGVRYFGSTPFWIRNGVRPDGIPAYLESWAALMLDATRGTLAEPFVWIQAFDVPGGREQDIELAVDVLVRSGVRTITSWSYLACVAMSGLACEDPEAAWDAISRAYQGASGRS
jgi:hypothetical protein